MNIHRFISAAKGRSKAVSFNDLAWIVANAKNPGITFKQQIEETFATAEQSLKEVGSSKEKLISVQVFLTDIHLKEEFDEHWNKWIGDNPDHWPQRACIQASLSAGLMIEIIMVAACSPDKLF